MSETTTNSGFWQGTLAAAKTGDGFLGWVPAIVIAYATLLSPLFFAQESADVADAAAAAASASRSNLANQLFWIGLFGAVIVSGRHRLGRLLVVLRQPTVIVILAYLALALASMLWSPVPSIAFRRAMLQVIVLTAIVCPVFMANDRQAQLERLVLVFLVTVIVNMVPVIFQPPGPIGHEGIYAHKNQFGLVAAYAFIFSLYAVVRLSGVLRLVAIACVFMALFELVVSQSKTSLGLSLLIPAVSLFVVGLSVLLGIRSVYVLLFGAALAITGYLFFNFLFDYHFSDLSMLLFNDTTFTGRTVIWDFIFGIISREPLFGQGYGSFWGIGPDSIVAREAPGFVAFLLQSHNGYVDVMLELGVVGFFLLILLLFSMLFDVSRLKGGSESANGGAGRAEAWLFMSVALVAICHNMLESSWFRGYFLAWLLFVLVAAFSSASRSTGSQATAHENGKAGWA